jgi:hypothetical protein
MPEGITSVKPQMKSGWEITITMRKLDEPIDAGHGQMITETVDEVAWRAAARCVFRRVRAQHEAAGRTWRDPAFSDAAGVRAGRAPMTFDGFQGCSPRGAPHDPAGRRTGAGERAG